MRKLNHVSDVGGGGTAHPQKFWVVKNPGKIP